MHSVGVNSCVHVCMVPELHLVKLGIKARIII